MEKHWHQLDSTEVLDKLDTTEEGLSTAEAQKRLQEYGKNELQGKSRGPLLRFLLQFHNPLLYILMVAAVVAFYLGEYLDMWVILGVVLATAVIGFIQEGKAESAIDSLREMLAPECTVLRKGKQATIVSSELVPGDIVLLESGDRIPADLRLIEGKNLALDESALTGESMAVKKQYDKLDKEDLVLAERSNMAFSGTAVTRGVGKGVVVATGVKTEMGKISKFVSGPQKSDPPIMRKIREFTKVIMVGIITLGAVNLFVGLRFGFEAGFVFLVSVGMIVAMVPEGLPAALVAAFSHGVTKMAHCGALIRKLPAVETLGATTVICSDKTGTLTKNEMTVKEVFCGDKNYAVSGTGYSPEGEFSRDDDTVTDLDGHTDLQQILLAGLLCNNAVLEKDEEDKDKIQGDPTEGALLVAAAKADISSSAKRQDELPFESDQQYMATLHRRDDDALLIVKGAPEKIITMCHRQLVDGNEEDFDGDSAVKEAKRMASDALRVLGFAWKRVSKEQTEISADDLQELTFLGLQGMMDPPREETMDAVRRCRDAGIRIVMITGDHESTARAIADKLHIGHDEKRAISGEDVAAMDDDQLFTAVTDYSVFARTSPEHKYRIVTQLQKNGHIVAVTGDGVNDAPALANADIGIAMGVTGTQVAKDSSDIVLTDDNFASIVSAVAEGRHTFNNIWKVILFLLPTNGGQGLAILAAILLSPFLPVFSERLPVEPIHILWVNLFMSISCAIPLTREPKEKGLLKRPPHDPEEKLVNEVFLRKVSIVSVVSASAAIIMFLLYNNGVFTEPDVPTFAQAQTVAFTTIILVQTFYLFTARWIEDSAFKHSLFSNPFLLLGAGITILFQLLIVYAEPLFGFSPLRTEPFPAHVWPYILLAASPGFFLIELEKLYIRAKKSNAAH
ncbi:cation-translocating P-type ATPase [Dethiobacter alkaliphilus]|uniref:cation-translocating P-type ATPase n=1 Tax=Dethiobacter alkaliphilus TaxID=427926 RepID=UPI002226D4C1|nr:HAD-IC family P-type ATPase [Dethiobacter alkaliphilus]MCW3491010.1 HAD-IC family P-type ATPase [Dethiobacter alkaliphilus]